MCDLWDAVGIRETMAMSEDRYGNPTYESIVGTPEEVIRDSEYPDALIHPLRRLQALCLRHVDTHQVGAAFRWDDEQIRLDDERTTTWQKWMWAAAANRRIYLYCPECDRPTRQAPKGAVEVEG